MIRIIGGEFRSRKLRTPEDAHDTRPYQGRVRESVFNLLRGWFEGARVLDLFAGVGTMGLEAVSRGAQEVVLVEKNRRIFGLLEENIRALKCADRAVAMLGDALGSACLLRAPRPTDLVFVDPPYEMMTGERSRRRVLDQAARCGEVMADRGFLILRSPLGPEAADLTISGLAGPEAHDHGKNSWVLLYQPLRAQSPSPNAGGANQDEPSARSAESPETETGSSA